MKYGLLAFGAAFVIMLSMGLALAQNETNSTDQNNTSGMNLTVNVTDTNMTGNSTNETNQTNTTIETTVTTTTVNGTSVNLYVKEWYPKDNDYVFVCQPSGFTPNSFSWWYGDGQKLLEIANGDTYHRFKNAGTYTVTCQGNGDGNPQDSMTVTVTQVTYCDPGVPCNTNNTNASEQLNARDNTAQLCSASASVGVSNSSARDYTFTCNDNTDINPVAYAWDFGDGTKMAAGQTATHTFSNDGSYQVSCVATDGRSTSYGQTGVTVASVVTNVNTNTNTNVNTTTETNTTNQTNTTSIRTLTATLTPTGGNESNASGTATATLNGTTLTVTGHLTGLSGNLSAGAPILLVRSSDSTIEFAFVVDNTTASTADFSLTTELTQSQIDTLLSGGYSITVSTVLVDNALSGTLTVQA